MITYLYWLLVAAAIFLALFGIGVRMGKWKPALITAPCSTIFGWNRFSSSALAAP